LSIIRSLRSENTFVWYSFFSTFFLSTFGVFTRSTTLV